MLEGAGFVTVGVESVTVEVESVAVGVRFVIEEAELSQFIRGISSSKDR